MAEEKMMNQKQTTPTAPAAPALVNPTEEKAKASALAPIAPKKEEKKGIKTASKKPMKEEMEKISSKPEKKKGKKTVWVKKAKVKKKETTKEMQESLSGKWKPVFWGRFGKKNLRTRRNKKFDKWKKPRGIDILRERNDGEIPNSGFRSPKGIRGTHPSGYKEVLVHSKKELDFIKENQAARISRNIGRKKKIELITYANQKNIPILN